MIVYFGNDVGGYYVCDEAGNRSDCSEATWWMYLKAANVTPERAQQETPIKIQIIERVILEKYDGEIGPDSIPVETLTL